MKQNIFYSKVFLGCLIWSFASCKKEVEITQKWKPELSISQADPRFQAGEIHFVKDTVYVLTSNLNINSGQTLLIEPGTLIKVKDKITVTINAGAQIKANGTKDEPVVFTSATFKGGAGNLVRSSGGDDQSFWYGLRIYGSQGMSSGNLNYVRIEFAGGDDYNYGAASVSLLNVDEQTTLQHIQVSYSFQTPSFYFSSGNVNASNLISYASVNSDIIADNGYKGRFQNVIAYRHPFFALSMGTAASLAGLLIKGDETDIAVSNLTVLGPDLQRGTAGKYYDTTSTDQLGSVYGSRVAAMIISGGKFHVRNSIISGFPNSAIYLDNATSASSLQQNQSEFAYSVFESDNKDRAFFLPSNIYPPYNSVDLRDFLLRQEYKNQQFYDIASFGFADPFNFDLNPDINLKPTSELSTGANYDSPVFSDPFFSQVAYRGAVSSNNNWLRGWTNFLPLQTDYNP